MADYSLPNFAGLFEPTVPPRGPAPVPRLQSMPLPNGRFLLVLDSWPGETEHALYILNEACPEAGALVVRERVDVPHAAWPVEDPCEMLPSAEDEAIVARLRQAYTAEAARQEAAGIELTEWRSAMWRALDVRPTYVEDPREVADADGALRELAVRTIVELRTDLRAAQDRIAALLREDLTGSDAA